MARMHSIGARFGASVRWLPALALAAILSACGGGGGGDAPAPSTTTSTATTTSSDPASTGSGTSTATPTTSTAPATTTTASADGASTAAAPLAAAGNLLPIVLDAGVDGMALNSPFASVTVCVPGTQTCKTIDHLLVDTGSSGLRVTASALRGLSLPAVSAPAGGGLGECASFASGYTWGSVRTADVRMAGERANGLSVQVIDDNSAPYGMAPPACSNTGPELGAGGSNGILGVGFATRDCGSACATSALPNMYFSCSSTGCSSVVAPLTSQVANPVPFFASGNNNGVAIVLPPVPTGGVPSVSGALVFGIGTRDNNQLGTLGIFGADSTGNFTTTYRGRGSPAFIDSGSNGLFFADSGIPRCTSGFYCPATTLSLSATITGSNGASRNVPFLVESPLLVASDTAAAHLGGSAILGRSFDWGLPFFFGRTVFVAFDGMSTPAGFGPFWAF